MRPARVVQKRSSEGLTPLTEHRCERALLYCRPQKFIERIDDSQSRDGRASFQFDHGGDHRSVWLDPHDVVASLEFPCREHAAVEAVTDTRVVQQFARMLRYAACREVGRRGRRDEMLNARA